ncbi:MAG TPA: FG-GAP-like repeat-containing protein, partial [Nitrospirota bacterium]
GSGTSSATLNFAGSRQGQATGFADVDGDGIADKLVGAPYATTTADQTGAVLVYKGSTTGFSSFPTAVFTGDDNFGYSIAAIGNDFAVGAIHGNGEDVSLSGSVTIYRGGGNGAVVKKLSGEWPMDKFGLSLAAGDLNGDGSADLVVGAPFNTNDPALYQAGAVYVFFGPDYATSIRLYASAANKGLGWSIATGDTNGDGIDDLVVSATGKVLVFFGNTTAFAPAIDAADITFTSAGAGFGKAIAVIGNIDGVAGGEIAIGSPNALVSLNTVTSRDVGSVSIVNGNGSSPINLDTATAGPAGPLITRLNGEKLFSRFGSSITVLGDINNGGKPDLAVGAPTQDVDWNILSGMVYVFKGEDIAAGNPWTGISAFSGKVRDHSYGTSLAGGILSGATGTMNALLIGAPRSNAGTGGVDMVNPATGQLVAGGSSGGTGGDSGDCH